MNKMIKIGSLYKVNGISWMLYSTQKCRCGEEAYYEYGEMMAKQLGASHVGHGELIIFLESNGCAKKVLTTKGEIGWIFFKDDERWGAFDSFEELTQ